MSSLRSSSNLDLAARLRLSVTRTARRLRQEADADLTPSQVAALATIDRRGPLTPSELAAAERIQRPTATRVAANLEQRGLVERTGDPQDGRVSLLSATEAGRALLRRMRSRKNAYLASRMADLPAEDLAALERAADVLERMLEDERSVTATAAALRKTFLSLGVPNYRRYFAGQVVSLSGNWVQIVAETWLILRLTDSGVAVGINTALQFAPMLVLGAFGGVLADRFDKRRLLMVTQTAMVVPALALFGLTVTGLVAPWMVFALVFARGTVLALDNPTRQSFVIEMVGSDRVVNAVSLNSVIVHSSRMIGPAIAGVLIATLGVGPCFLVNAISFAVMLLALSRMDPAALVRPERSGRRPRALREAVRYVAATPALAVPLAMMALVGTLGFNFQVLLPLLARFTFGGGPGTYAALVVAMGAGSVAGALTAGARGRVSGGLLIGSSAAFGAFTVLAALAPTLPLAVAALALVGAASVTFAAGVNSTLQLEVEPSMRGRVMALYSVVFLGSTPIGGPLAGWLAQAVSPRAGLLLGALAALTAAGGALAFSLRRSEGHHLVVRHT